MKKFSELKHWKIFSILLIPMFISIISYSFNPSISIFLRILGIIIYFTWLMIAGLRFNSYKKNYYKFSSSIYKLAIFFCITGYSEMNLKHLLGDNYFIPVPLEVLLTLLTFFSVIYVLFCISKSFRSIILKRNAIFSEYIIDFLLFFIFPIGIWIIQPKINTIFGNE